MAYLPYTYVPRGTSGKKRMSYTLPHGGVMLSEGEGVMPDGKCGLLVNAQYKNGRIESVDEHAAELFGFNGEGRLNGFLNESFCRHIVFHVGTRLYAFDGNGSPVCVAENIPDAKSLMCNFMSKLYIYCKSRVYSLDTDFNFTEEQPKAVKLYENYNPVISSNQRLDVPFNLLAPRITVNYHETVTHTFKLPHSADTQRPIEAYADGERVPESMVEITEDIIYVKDGAMPETRRVVDITYYLKNPEEAGFERIIEGCGIVCPFGGNAGGGTRLFFTGNPDRKGYYYKGEFQDPLYCGADSFEILGDGSENVTAVKEMYGSLILFTQSSVYKMSYTLEKDGAFFSTKCISSYVGCDCPNSVQLIDNRVVFLNSERGAFIVDSTDEAGEHNIKPLSGNIQKGGGMGLLDNGSELVKAALSLDFGRKYMLFVGQRVYIWDYDKTAFYESSSYSKAQERLCWYMCDAPEASRVFELNSRAFSLCGNDGAVTVGELFCEDDSDGFCGIFDSGNITAFGDGKRRFVTGMAIKMSRSENCSATVELFADGKKYFEKQLHKRVSQKEKIFFSLPSKALYDFRFRITLKGKYCIDSIETESREING